MRSRRLVLTAIVLLATLEAPAAPPDVAEADAPERPRVGLVLGGGGARGAAHVGVLRELERLRVPIDAIAGTSMGAFIGGLYASGMDAEALEALLETTDWASLMSDAPQRRDLDFRRREDDGQLPMRLELGVSDGAIRMPMGLLQGHHLDLLLRRLTLDVAHIRDFDELPIPFRAVASDIVAAQAYVIDHGSLATAMRASMAVPGILAPVEMDDRLLVDGGLFANLPIDVIRAMDVDVIIAVSVEFPLYPAEELDSAFRISEQMLTILIRKETQRQIATLGPHDVLIEPDLGTYASTDFSAVTEVVRPGAVATLRYAPRLAELAVSETAYAAYRESRTTLRRPPSDTLAFVRIRHDDTLPDRMLEARILTQPGDAVDPARLAADADRLLGLGLYEQVTWRLVKSGGQTGVVFDATTKGWGRDELRFGLSLVDDFEGVTAVGLSARFTKMALNRRGAEWRTDLRIGTNPRLATEFYQPVRPGADLFVAPWAELARTSISLFDGEDQVGRQRITERRLGLDVGRRLGDEGEFRVGLFRGTGSTSVRIGDPVLDSQSFDTGGLRARLRFDTLDDAHFPTRGSVSDLRWRGSRTNLGADTPYDAFRLDVDTFLTRGRNTFGAGLALATTGGSVPGLSEQFALGGFLNLSGIERDALRGPHAALARLVYRRRAGSLSTGVFSVPAFVGASLEAGSTWASRSDAGFSSTLFGGSVFGALDTYLGPIYLGAGFAEGGLRNYFLFVGAPPR
ncbi:MAG: patatin-like phospholipase family protein [Woeseiaceae bacterium]|nr:patatin-like phospholipase family protein [Woeseiaceae bacterium]